MNTETTETTEENLPRLLVIGDEAAYMAEELFSVVSVVSVFQGFLLDHQRNFRVDRPTRTSIIVMIQNRTTT